MARLAGNSKIPFTDKGVAPTGALTATWFTSFGTLAVLLTPALSNRDAPMAAAWLTPLIGGAVLHIAFKKLTDAHPQIHAASIFGAALVAAQSFAGLLGEAARRFSLVAAQTQAETSRMTNIGMAY